MKIICVRKYKDSNLEVAFGSKIGREIQDKVVELTADNYLVATYNLGQPIKRRFNNAIVKKATPKKVEKTESDSE